MSRVLIHTLVRLIVRIIIVCECIYLCISFFYVGFFDRRIEMATGYHQVHMWH